jgi:DNA-directed RNA polymerase omega subunit
MSKITVDEAVVKVGGNRFDLVLIASERAREITRGSAPRLQTTTKPISTALEEIEQGLYTREEWLAKIQKKFKD